MTSDANEVSNISWDAWSVATLIPFRLWLLLPTWETLLAITGIVFVLCLYLLHLIGYSYSKYRLHRTVEFNPNSPGVSILKPLLGVDKHLKFNLQTFFTMKFPKFELLFCVKERHDPAVSIVKQLMDMYPATDAKIFYGGEDVGLNPKINNLMPAYRNAKYPLVMISDAAISMRSDSLMDMVNAMEENVALVTQVPYCKDREGFAGALEQIYFGTSHSRIYLAGNCMQFVCSTGMSSLMRKFVLDECGGLAAFGDVLAEDYFIGLEFSRRGWLSAISTHPALQNGAEPSVAKFHARISRWMQLRIAMLPHMMLVEPLQDCFTSGFIGCLCANYLFGVSPIVYYVAHCTGWLLCDYALNRSIQNGPLPYRLPGFILAWAFREAVAPLIYIRAIMTPCIRWRNGRFRLHWGGKIKSS
ncbi:hypothetical protein DICVIV_02496 [Dictyocaulus viviparus]|uniref:ceramide glucosyltransferase n=1 Tax=Dictyocaulus viviparus TaxID=29172 RepID=A0A0D8Y368_DICVI|nr:hypothetical protein DICVIV_02496 [Dictyocaulus viviparus]